MTDQKRLIRTQGIEEGLSIALQILEDLAEVMLERERKAQGKKANHARRTRIKAYQVAAGRVETQLKRNRRLIEKLDAMADPEQDAGEIEAAVADLAL